MRASGERRWQGRQKRQPKKKEKSVVRNSPSGHGWGVPLPTCSISAESPKVGLQLGLGPAVWELIYVAQLDQLLFGHDGTEGQISKKGKKGEGEGPCSHIRRTGLHCRAWQ